MVHLQLEFTNLKVRLRGCERLPVSGLVHGYRLSFNIKAVTLWLSFDSGLVKSFL